ncbi:ATP-binding protein [Moorella naiadis]|uniref:ATP-binding protein n=1 Tax=Moorella naiadis (nom. illeg.) TaxID=3093670 RepID=UPI003D9C936B
MIDPAVFAQIYCQNTSLLIYRDLAADPVVAAFLEVCRLLGSPEPGRQELDAACRRFFSLLAAATELSREPLTGDPWQNYLLDCLIAAENTFTLKAEQRGAGTMGAALQAAVRQDLTSLQALAGLAPAAYQAARAALEQLGDTSGRAAGTIPDWTRFQPLDPDLLPTPLSQELKDETGAVPGSTKNALQPAAAARRQVKEQFLATADWGQEGLEFLAAYYRTYGAGLYGTYRAFRWEHGPQGGRLAGIADPDPITLADLIGYEDARSQVVHNTERFLRGLPAVNVLLYGARGTGKSSTVKALLNAYGDRGLRLIELPKRYLSDYQEILKTLTPRPQKFIIFIDDLSFEEDEVEYKELKGLLEGSLQVRPANVLVYATSNRRHLVKESFADRTFNPAGGEVRLQDTVQEKLSLAERFGLTVIFPSPDQEEYLTIVRELARKAGLEMEAAELRRRALQWALYQNGASGRTARQFVDYLLGEEN